MKSNVAIVILNWNGWKDTIECLDSILLLKNVQFSIVVVDNASSDNSESQILAWATNQIGRTIPLTSITVLSEFEIDGPSLDSLAHRDFVFIRASANGGFAAGNNLGIRFAIERDVDYVWILNNDTVVLENSLSSLVDKANNCESIGICGSVLVFYHVPNRIQAIGGVEFNLWLARGKQLGQELGADSPEVAIIAEKLPTYISGASMLVRRQFLDDIGLMEEGYFLYYEEIDWAYRSKDRWQMAISANSVVLHKEGGSIGTSSMSRRSAMSQYYLCRNLIRFYWLRVPLMLPIAIARVLREAQLCLVQKDWGRLRATGRALLDAVSGVYGKTNAL